MRLLVQKNGQDSNLYIIKSIRKGDKTSTVIVQKCGKLSELKKVYEDPIEHFKQVAKQLTKEEKDNKEEFIVKFNTTKKIKPGEKLLFSGGYLFLKKIYYDLNLHRICKDIVSNKKVEYDLNNILETLVYSRIINPNSKLSTYQIAKNYIEKPNFELHDIYRSLDVLAEHLDYIQAALYKQSLNVIDRNTTVLYYDCTNYFFEIEKEDNIRTYGMSKEHKPNPIVQMGLFIDGNGIPLGFSIFKGSQNEQISLKPLEETIIRDFNLSQFIICTDAGLSSFSNKYFNSINNRAFITTQSIKKLKDYLKKWALNDNDWKSTNKKINKIADFDFYNSMYDDKELNKTILYKSTWIYDEGSVSSTNKKLKDKIEQKLIITFSQVYKEYQQTIRNKQIDRAIKIMNNPNQYNKTSVTDCKRFIKNIKFTKEGEIATNHKLELDIDAIAEESKYDGFYCVATTLDEPDLEIVKINHNRWKIEESFRLLKTDFRARPVYLTRENRIKAHFLTCFISLLIYRILEYKLEHNFTPTQIRDTLKNFNFFSIKSMGYTPAFERNELTDKLQELTGIQADFEAITNRGMRKIITKVKNG